MPTQFGARAACQFDCDGNAGKAARRVAVAKTPEGKKSAVIGAVGATATLGGVPSSGVATSLAKGAFIDPHKLRHNGSEPVDIDRLILLRKKIETELTGRP